MHDYLGCVKAVDESVGRVLEFLEEEGLAENTHRRLRLRPGLLSRRARLVRQALDLRGVAAHAAAGPLAGRDQAGQREHATWSRTSISPRRFSKRPACRFPPRCRAAASSAFCAARRRPTGARLLLPLLRVSRTAPRRAALRRRDRPVQARAFHRPRVDYWELFDRQADPHELRSVYDRAEYAETQRELTRQLDQLRTDLHLPEHDPPEAFGNAPASASPKNPGAS